MGMQDSFSIAVEPTANIKTIKQYEDQIEQFRSENFEIKHQLNYYRMNSNNKENKGNVDPSTTNKIVNNLKKENLEYKNQLYKFNIEYQKCISHIGEKEEMVTKLRKIEIQLQKQVKEYQTR